MALSDLRSVGRNEEAVRRVVDVLKQRFGDRFQTGQAIREQTRAHHHLHPVQAPDGPSFPDSAEEVQEIVRVCAEHRVPVIPFGAGSSLEGQVNAPGGGISIDSSRMNRIIAVNPEDLDWVVEPGVTRIQLNEHLRDTGLFFPIDPGANATLGGMASTRASGTNAVRYGTMRENVLSLSAVDGGRHADLDGQARQEELGRIRPDAADRRIGGHARRDHGAHRQALRHSAGNLRRRVPVPERGRRRARRRSPRSRWACPWRGSNSPTSCR